MSRGGSSRSVRAGAAAAALLLVAMAAPGGAVFEDVIERIDLPPRGSAPADALYVVPQFDVAMTHQQIQYGEAENSRGELEQLFLDVYQPVGHEVPFRPAMVFAPGGGFVYVGQSEYWIHQLVERGYVVALMTSYRVRPELPTGFEEFISVDGAMAVASGQATDAARDAQHDMQAAVRWVRANAEHLRVDATRIAVSGYSAGAITSWLVAYNHGDVGDTGNPGWPSHVSAAISGAGGYIVGLQEEEPLGPGLPPVLAFHGAVDTTVPVVFGLGPCANTVAVGNVCELQLYPGEDHSMRHRWDEFANDSADFLWRHVISADRVASSFADLTAATHGSAVNVSGRLIDESDTPLAGQRILGRATAGWAETTTDDEGWFTLTVHAPDHGASTSVELRYHGHSTPSWLDDPPTAPAAATVTASWGTGNRR